MSQCVSTMNTPNISKLMGIFGTGRSGSSWLGSIIDSHPQVAYRFEPFHRLKDYSPISQARQLLLAEKLQASDLTQIYQALLPAHPVLERPPFFPKNYGFTLGKAWVRVLTRKSTMLQPLFKWLYTTNTQPPIVFKEVTEERIMLQLLARTVTPIVYLVRHPCAVTLSTVTGQKQQVMPTGRHNILDKILKRHDPALFDQYTEKLEMMDLLEKEALLWRIDVEKGISATQTYENALLVIYENLCDNPLTIAKQVFTHFGLDFSSQTSDYLNALTQSEPSETLHEFGVKSYFSVNKNPALMKDKWKQKMTSADQQRVLSLVQSSDAFQLCATLGKWD